MEILLVRSLALLAFSAGLLAHRGRQAAWPWRSERRWVLLLRGFLGTGGIVGLFVAIQLLPLADVSAIGLLIPVFVSVAAPLALGEGAARGSLAALPLCAAGVLLVAQPSFLFGASAEPLPALGLALAVLQAAVVAANKLVVRSLGGTEPVPSIMMSMAGVSVAVSASLCALLPNHWVLPRGADTWALLGGAGLTACGVQLAATTALKLSRAVPVVMVSYLTIVWGLLADLALFNHAPSPLSMAGAALVCASSFLIVYLEQRSSGRDGGSRGGGGRQAALEAAPLQLKRSDGGEIALEAGIPVLEVVFFRSFFLLVLSAAMLARQGPAAAWPWRSKRRWLLLLRGVLGLASISALYYAVQLLPLADVATIAFLAPVLVAAAAPLALGERTGRGVAAALVLCVIGVALVAQPTFLFGAGTEPLSALGVAVALTQAGFSAATKLCTRALGSTESVASIILAMAAVSTLGSAALCASFRGQWAPHAGAAGVVLLAATGLLGCGVQLLNTLALKLSRAAPTSAMS
ncbi:Solute carrier family 35 member G1 isoform A [Micractinium conductrix]|uniref:Solute carrier family 35 member G1 isoform A n=1 Tax=Micractinium conductrix TaxID=554055 RepID=A0A2P6VIK8_9CHLO|nr:Solute carrier family 35 member G1 isoform A [Micractinium conductrix]|eukprot:PSC73933.1 Solute carrier family 35 member G1 isoform A [Micractinium conductrix]